ncbi:MAG: DUF1573 domain-containing protein [Bacteroidales bacterium]|jgi:hypothetical protein|nr:DUF1573 domain-containing protein [Bacteroidales bacterium]
MKSHLLLLFLVISACSVFSCKNNRKRLEATDIITEWAGKEIIFPENVSCYTAGKDTLPLICNEWFDREFKILMYVDSAGCSSCRLNLFEWNQLIEEADSLFQGKVGFLLYFQPKNERDMVSIFARDRFNYPVFMDINGEINRLNRFPQAMEYQCFLLDKDNKALMIGNPVLNPGIWELYKEQIAGEKKTEQRAITTVTAGKTVHEYGNILKGSSNPAVFTITNTGNNPLVISRVSASCGCTDVEWEKRPVAPGQTTTISVNMTPDETGFFSKTIDVYCNVDNSPVRLTLNGNANE